MDDRLAAERVAEIDKDLVSRSRGGATLHIPKATTKERYEAHVPTHKRLENMRTIETHDVRLLLAEREVDLYLVPPPSTYELCLHGQFLEYGDFFSLLVRNVAFVELAGGFTVGDVVSTDDPATLSTLVPRWKRLATYEGIAVAFRTGSSDAWGPDADGSVIIASHFEWIAGDDWDRAIRRADVAK